MKRQEKIIVGSVLRDYWNRKWFVVEYNFGSSKWLMKLVEQPYQCYFSTKEIENIFEIIAR